MACLVKSQNSLVTVSLTREVDLDRALTKRSGYLCMTALNFHLSKKLVIYKILIVAKSIDFDLSNSI